MIDKPSHSWAIEFVIHRAHVTDCLCCALRNVPVRLLLSTSSRDASCRLPCAAGLAAPLRRPDVHPSAIMFDL